MIRFALFGFPFVIQWTFWLGAAFISGGFYAQTAQDWERIAVRVAVVLLSISVHELGHAFAGRHYGCKPVILLHSFGGLTFLNREDPRPLSRWEQFIISAAGPAFGLLLAGAVYLLTVALPDLPYANKYLGIAISFALWANTAWSLMNLLPILPMDGGQIFRCILGPGPIREKIARWVGATLAVGIGLWLLFDKQFYNALIFGGLAWANIVRKGVTGGTVTEEEIAAEQEADNTPQDRR